jgi:hypothetical protein
MVKRRLYLIYNQKYKSNAFGNIFYTEMFSLIIASALCVSVPLIREPRTMDRVAEYFERLAHIRERPRRKENLLCN